MGHRHASRASGDPLMPEAAAVQHAPPDETSEGSGMLESKVVASATVAGVFVPTVIWLLGVFDVEISPDAALGLTVALIVAGGMVGGMLWPSRTSVVSSGFSPRAIPNDPVLRQRIKSEVTAHPAGATPPRDKRHELGYGVVEMVVGVLLVIILVVVLLRVL